MCVALLPLCDPDIAEVHQVTKSVVLIQPYVFINVH